MMKDKIEMDKPTYIGQTILGLSKILIYELCHDYMIPIWDKENLQVYFLDTDILIIQTEHLDVNKLKMLK